MKSVEFKLVLPVLAMAAGVLADTVEITELHNVIAETGKVYRAAAPLESVDFPSDVGTPIFWLDCSVTNGWEISADGIVTKACSRVGSRYLTSTATRPFDGKYSKPNLSMKPPRLVADDELLAGPALDFGVSGGCTGLVFDAIQPDANCTASNALYGVATVVAVYNAREGGGFLMGGGGYLESKGGYRWHRGYSTWGVKDDVFDRWWNPVFLGHAPLQFYTGYFWHDGVRTDPQLVGFSGGWEVVATEPRNELGLVTSDATGLGIGDSRASMGYRSGGMRIAEMLVFSTQLTSNQLAKLDLYLDAKWLGRTRRGRNGRSVLHRLNTTTDVANTKNDADPVTVLDVPAGQKLELGKLNGGRCSCISGYAQIASLLKTGEGTLEIGNAAAYSGEIVVKGGCLRFGGFRSLPAELPFGAVARFDASDDSAFDTETVEGAERVSVWRSSEAQTFRGGQFILSAPSDTVRPIRCQDKICGTLKKVVDFGTALNAASGGKYLQFATNAVSPVKVKLPDLVSVIYVMRPRAGKVNFLGSSFAHGSTWNSNGLLPASGRSFCSGYNGKYHTWYPAGGIERVNGHSMGNASGSGYESLGYQVVTLQIPGTAAEEYLGYVSDCCGGFVLAEAVLYNRLLTEREVADAEAYLSAKWLGHTPTGYVRMGLDATDTTPEVQHLISTADGEIYVAAGRTVRVGTISGTIVKTGEGILEVQSSTVEGECVVVVKGGKVTYALGADPGDETMQIASSPSLHLDASDADSFEYEPLNGTNFVQIWRGKDDCGAAFACNTNKRPWVDASAAKLKNGKTVVDFGTFGTTGKGLALDRPLDGVRSAFVVWDAEEGGGWLLGSVNAGCAVRAGQIYDFHRGIEDGKTFGVDSQLFYATSPSAMVYLGSILTNGVPTDYAMIPARTMQLVEVHTLAGAHVSALACDRGLSARWGGQRLAEVILYERELSEREKAATRNYLMKKWFNREPEALPDKPEIAGEATLEYVVPYGETMNATAGNVQKVIGGGTLEKIGEGILSVNDLSGFTGTVNVTEGALRLTGAAPAAGELVESGRTLHFDAASAGLETETNSLGQMTVKAWRNLVDGTWTAEKGVRDSDTAPDVLPFGLNGMPVVDMKSDSGQYLAFKKNGKQTFVDNIHSVFWVIGSQNGGGYLMGGGTNQHYATDYRYPWHRGIVSDTTNPGLRQGAHSAPLVHSSHAQKELRDGTTSWYLNGKSVKPTQTGLSGEWDVMSMTLPDSCGNVLNAEGFAVDGRWMHTGSQQPGVRGHQRLAEVIIYNRALTDAERTANENYLLRKWGVRTRASVTNGATVNLSGGALDLGGVDQYVGALAGAGMVTNGNLTAGALLADATAAAWPVLTGEFIAPAVLELEFAHLSALGNLSGKRIKLLEANSASGLDTVKIAASGEPLSHSVEPRLVFNNGELAVALRRISLTINFR